MTPRFDERGDIENSFGGEEREITKNEDEGSEN